MIEEGDGPLAAVAVHDGHAVRDEVARRQALSPADRRREEDPYTGRWARALAPTHAVARRSRFEVDLNRPPDRAVYESPEDAWGLAVWENNPPPLVIDRSLKIHKRFYDAVEDLMARKIERHGRILVLDLHSYCHRRRGPDAPPGDPEDNPEIDIVTGPMHREHWAPVVERFKESLRAFDFRGRSLDVRENVKFRGGYFGERMREQFPRSACSIMVEVKKFYMDEWTGELYEEIHADIEAALDHATQATLETVHDMPETRIE
jgi:N-formylglutamate amidohydrolase